jgi:hypothetical protein
MMVHIKPAPASSKKKWIAQITNPTKQGSTKTLRFGARGYQDYTMHKDTVRKDRYLARHATNENWTLSGIYTAGFWSRYLLWNKTNLLAAKYDIQSRFPVKIKLF